jgi:hypothetical protein
MMRVRFQVSGGIGAFPGLAAPRTIDMETLGPDDRHALKQLVDEANFFGLPPRVPAPPGSADTQTYQITIEEEGREHTVIVSDPVASPAMQALVSRLRQLTRSAR